MKAKSYRLLIWAFLYNPTANNQKDGKPNPSPPRKISTEKPELKRPATQPAVVPSQIMLPLSISANAVTTAAPSLTTVTPQPVIVNNQVFLVQK